MTEVVVVCPQERDRTLIRAARLEARYAIRYAGRDLDSVSEFDPRAFLAEWGDARADGVVGTKDRSAFLASLLAERHGLPGPRPAAIVNCQHKAGARTLHRLVGSRVTPAFAVVTGPDDAPPACPPPWFAKPIVGRLSQGARRVDSRDELGDLADPSGYAEAWAEIAELAGVARASARGFLVEELARGAEVTLEGYVFDGRVTVVGITDSVMYPRTNSFQRFEYPSVLGLERQAELRELAELIIPALGFDGGFFNIEFVVPAEGPPTLIEVNGRIASQFAPMVQVLHGRSTYDALFALAVGCDPAWRASPPDGVAVSYVLRAFADAFVESIPEVDDDVEILVRPGKRLSEQGVNDVESYRVAIVYCAGETRTEAVERCRARLRSLRLQMRSALVA